jgi:hypothetical protein
MTRLLAAVIFALTVSFLNAPVVSASCAGPVGPGGASSLQGQLETAAVVFVGTVVGTSNADRVARVKVETVWKGGGIPTFVTVSGTPDGSSAAMSVDRRFRVGQRYLFAPYSASSPYQDNNCSVTQSYSSRLDGLRPTAAHPPVPGSDGLDPTGLAFVPISTWAALSLFAAAGALLAAVLFRRARRDEFPPSGGQVGRTP